MAKNITITIDNKKVKTEAGRSLVEVAKENGIFIPTLCHFKDINPPLGTCRVCACIIDGRVGPACMETVKDGMEVEVHTESLKNTRKAIVEMMFAEGNHFCPSCEKSGDCDLQHMGYEMGVSMTRFQHLFKDQMTDFKPKRMIIEHSRCIKCRRCVEEIHNKDKKQIFSFQNRGNQTIVGIDYEEEAKLSKKEAEHAMYICPTGAILIRGKSLARPFGDRQFDMQSIQKEMLDLTDTPKNEKGEKEKKTIATISLAGCFGCHMSLLDIDLGLLDIVEFVDFDKSPLTDIKEFSKQCDVGIIEGGCCNSENVEVLREFRKKCDKLVVVGECAIWGGLPAMRNTIPLGECLEEAYLNGITSETGEYIIPNCEDLPKILDKVYPCNEIVKIDHYIPGCPPSPEHMWKAVKNILWEEEYSILYSEFKYD